MRNFSIKELERLSGVKAHTIRIWESRYNILVPTRSVTNYRSYTVGDLGYLLNVAFLVSKGYKISRIAAADKDQLEQRLQSYRNEEDRKIKAVNDLLIRMYSEDTDGFESMLDQCIGRWKIERTIYEVILPFLEKADLLSYSSNSTYVHFAVTALRKKIIFGIESLSAPASGSTSALLFLFKGEHYDLILLCINYILKACGIRVLYLGTNVSLDGLTQVVADKAPTVAFSYVTSDQLKERNYPKAVKDLLQRTKLYLFHTAAEGELVSETSNVKFRHLHTLDRLKEMFSPCLTA